MAINMQALNPAWNALLYQAVAMQAAEFQAPAPEGPPPGEGDQLALSPSAWEAINQTAADNTDATGATGVTDAASNNSGRNPNTLGGNLPPISQPGLCPQQDATYVEPAEDISLPDLKTAPKADFSISIDKPTAKSPTIGPGYAGLSYETYTLTQNPNYFNPDNTKLINEYKAMGIKNLRIGGDTVDYMGSTWDKKKGVCVDTPASLTEDPSPQAVTNLMEFAKKAGVKVTWTVRLLNGEGGKGEAGAELKNSMACVNAIWPKYKDQLASFAIGNEPDNTKFFNDKDIHQSSNAENQLPNGYLQQWLNMADRLPKGAPISGPDWAVYQPTDQNGSPIPNTKTGPPWLHQFLTQEKKFNLVDVTTHNYTEGGPKNSGSNTLPGQGAAQSEVDAMLSNQPYEYKNSKGQMVTMPDDDNLEKAYIDGVAKPLEADHQKVFMDEANDELVGNPRASDSQASAVWTIDSLFQYAQGGVSGVDFHNLRPSERAIYETPNDKNFGVNPKGEAMAAFNHFCQGQITPVRLTNTNARKGSSPPDMTAYAVTHADGSQCLALLNKTYGKNDSQMGEFNLKTSQRVTITYLNAPKDDVEATKGIALGGEMNNGHETDGEISSNSADFKYTTVTLKPQDGSVTIEVPPASVAFVNLPK